MKNLVAIYTHTLLENNLEIARTSRDTRKTPLINYVIGNNKKKNLREETRITRIPWKVTSTTIVTSERRVSYKSIYKPERKDAFFSKTVLQVRATNNSDLQVNNHGKTNRLQLCTYVKLFFNANLLIRDSYHSTF